MNEILADTARSLTIEEIHARSIDRSSATPVVYFLLKDDVVVYVGSTIDPHSRIASHRASTKDYNRYFIMQVALSEMHTVEAYYTNVFKPIYNITNLNGDTETTLYDFIVKYKSDHDGCTPSMRQIGNAIGVRGSQHVKNKINALQRRGLIQQHGKTIMVVGAQWIPPATYQQNGDGTMRQAVMPGIRLRDI